MARNEETFFFIIIFAKRPSLSRRKTKFTIYELTFLPYCRDVDIVEHKR